MWALPQINKKQKKISFNTNLCINDVRMNV